MKYVLLFGSLDKRPGTKHTKYWEGASRFIVDNYRSRRTSTFSEEFYESGATEEQSLSPEQVPANSSDRSNGGDSDDDHQGSSQPSSSASITIESLDTLELITHKISCIDPDQQLKFIEELLARYCFSLNLSLPTDFLLYSVKGMVQLQAANRSNFLYSLAKEGPWYSTLKWY